MGEVVGSGEAVSIEVFGHVPPDGSADRCVVGDVGGVKCVGVYRGGTLIVFGSSPCPRNTKQKTKGKGRGRRSSPEGSAITSPFYRFWVFSVKASSTF